MNAIQIAVTVLKLIPAVIEAMKAIEEAIPGKGEGEKKLEAVRQIVQGVYTAGAEIWPQLSTAINVLVDLFNRTGVFKK